MKQGRQESKTELNRKLREYKSGMIDKKEFTTGTKRYKRICTESEEKPRKEKIEKIMNVKDETGIWKHIMKERGKKVKIDDITVDKWKQHFINLLKGTERSGGEERKIKVEGGETEKIKKEDIEEAIRKLKKKKIAGVNGIRNEAWKYANENVRERLKKIMNGIWKVKEWPEDWKKVERSPGW